MLIVTSQPWPHLSISIQYLSIKYWLNGRSHKITTNTSAPCHTKQQQIPYFIHKELYNNEDSLQDSINVWLYEVKRAQVEAHYWRSQPSDRIVQETSSAKFTRVELHTADPKLIHPHLARSYSVICKINIVIMLYLIFYFPW